MRFVINLLINVIAIVSIASSYRTMVFRSHPTQLLRVSSVDSDEKELKIPVGDKNSKKSDNAVTWTAAIQSSCKVKETKRTVESYMALPASEYSVLTADQIVRLSDTEFKCTLGNLNFFGTKICPILYVTVEVFPDQARSEIIVTRAETVGSETAELINGTFSISAVNIVSAGIDKKGRKTLNSDTKLKIDVVVPQSKIPTRIIKSSGNFIMQSSLNIIVPTFIRILASDFKRWSAGNDSRDAVDGASLSIDQK